MTIESTETFAQPLTALDAGWSAVQSSIEVATRDIVGASALAVDRAEAYRQVLRFLGHAHDYCIEHADTGRPTFYEFESPQRKVWGDCPDTIYHLARIDGDHAYRIRGMRGSVHYLGFQLYRSLRAGPGNRVADVLSGEDLAVEADGSFELYLSKERMGSNWLPLDAWTNELAIRQYRLDKASERPASFSIEVIRGAGPATETDPMDFARKLGQLARLVESGVRRTVRLWENLCAHPNRFVHECDLVSDFSGTKDNIYHIAAYRLAPDEVLELWFTPPQSAVYWGVHLCNPWFESLEYRDRQVSLNMAQCVPSEDGTVRIVVSPRDPGAANWLDTVGHPQGMVIVRFMRSSSAPVPDMRVLRSNH